MATKKNPVEGRGNHRVTTVLPVDCRVFEFPAERTVKIPLALGQSFGGRTINVSKTGLLINSDYELDIRTKVEVILHVQHEGQRRTIRVLAQVARTRRNAYDLYGRWGMGLHFLEIQPKDLQLLSKLYLETSAKTSH